MCYTFISMKSFSCTVPIIMQLKNQGTLSLRKELLGDIEQRIGHGDCPRKSVRSSQHYIEKTKNVATPLALHMHLQESYFLSAFLGFS